MKEPTPHFGSKFRFWAAVVIAILFALGGFLLADLFVLPFPFTPNTTKIVYVILGILLSTLFFSRITSWVVRTAARLFSLAIRRLAQELSDQFSRATAHGVHLPGPSPIPQESLERLKKELSGVIILDTSSLIDGRVLEVARTGFLCGLVLIPDFVLHELQLVSDSSDAVKRARGRRGFEIVQQMKKIRTLKIEVWDKTLAKLTKSEGDQAVDDRLISLAKTLEGKILTCDFNLNQVAKLRGVGVLNINDLSNALRTLPVPGETLQVKIVHPGKDKDQMVGYLSDGTMVVVKDAPQEPDTEVSVQVNKILQGSAGRMVFGKVAQ